MKICRYINLKSPRPEPRLGIIGDNGIIIDPNYVWACEYEREGFFNFWEKANHTCPSSLSNILKIKDNPIEFFQECYGLYLFLEKVGDIKLKDGTPIFFTETDISLKNPIDHINCYRDFYAHEKHVQTGFAKRNEPIPPAWYEIPAYYKGATAGFIGPNENILWPNYTNILDYELEMAMIISRDGKNIKEKNANDHIFGFTILNDISARDIQRKEMAIRLGPAKGKDFCSILGPVIVTYDEFDYKEPNLLMTAKVNGKLWSSGYSGDSHFSWAQMIAHVAQDEWVIAGDVFGSGTVGTGCGLELDKWIQPNDILELEIERIGKLINTVGTKE